MTFNLIIYDILIMINLLHFNNYFILFLSCFFKWNLNDFFMEFKRFFDYISIDGLCNFDDDLITFQRIYFIKFQKKIFFIQFHNKFF